MPVKRPCLTCVRKQGVDSDTFNFPLKTHFVSRKRRKHARQVERDGRRCFIGKKFDGGGAFRADMSRLLSESLIQRTWSRDRKSAHVIGNVQKYNEGKRRNSSEYQDCVERWRIGRKRHHDGQSAFGKVSFTFTFNRWELFGWRS